VKYIITFSSEPRCRWNLALHPGLDPTYADFHNNPGWKPAAYTAAITAGAHKYDIKAADILATPPPNQALVLNKENIGVYVVFQCPQHIRGGC
jgi:hypothetical protein